MKKVFSIALCVMMIVSLFAVNASAAISLAQDKTIDLSEKGEVIVAAQTYEDSDSSKFFTSASYDVEGIAIVNEVEDDATSNKVKELKYSAPVTYDEDGTTVLTAPQYNNVQLIDGKQSTNILSDGTVVPETYMVEFDVCAKDNSIGLVFARRCAENGLQAAVAMDPDTMTVDTWYTYRFYVDESAYREVRPTEGATTLTSAQATAGRLAFRDGIKAYRKERGSSADFEDVSSSLLVTTAGNGALSFVLIASDKYILRDDIDQTKKYYIEASKKDVFVDALSVCYQLDNIGVYGYEIPEDYEISTGVVGNFDMESVKTSGSKVKFEQAREENGNGYMKMYCDTTVDATNTVSREYSANYALTSNSEIGDYFAMTFDLNNMSPGFALSMEVYADYDGGYSNTADAKFDYFGRSKVVIESDPTLAGTWYSYKVTFNDSPDNGDLTPKVYRRLRGSNDEWVELTTHRGYAAEVDNEKHDAFVQGTASSSSGRVRTWRIGCYSDKLMAYGANETDENGVLKNLTGVWAIDNVQIIDGVAVTGTVELNSETVAALINVSGATLNCDPIVAIFDAENRFVDLGYATVTGEGSVRVTADGFAEGYTAKLYVWDSVAEGMPLCEGIDITAYL